MSKYTVDSSERVFMVTWGMNDKAFCNFKDLNEVAVSNNLRSGYFDIYHFWDRKAKRASTKLIRDMYAGARVKQEFEYK